MCFIHDTLAVVTYNGVTTENLYPLNLKENQSQRKRLEYVVAADFIRTGPTLL